ncbi:type IV secretion system DNA-binding domain-containing protein [Serratia nevei]|uniref:type IV secretion system DNA-binding domain-containing protein n=1 Tax=Serratia nevei TaxID=2703794 RepID=UPI00254AC91E|nr:type IV secretion system DNA-binding domain-containing protein [Serratia nevei]MDK5165495.1 type IV secretion system DNA-binding domain-containing protein [Serratia nevei]
MENNEQLAMEISSRLIVEGKDPMWSNSAKLVLFAFLKKLMGEKPSDWKFRDLAEMLNCSDEEACTIVKEQCHFNRDLLDDAESMMTQSILMVVRNSMPNMGLLATA